MRRLTHEPDEAAAVPMEGDGAFAHMSWRELAPYYLFVLACLTVSPYLGLDSFEVDPRISEIWPPGVGGFVLLTVIWYVGRRAIVVTLALMFLIFAVTALLLDHPLHNALWWALAAAVQPLLMVLFYRRLLSHPGWVPQSPRDVAALLYASVASSLLVGLAGGFPTLDAGEFFSKVLLWWVLRNTVFCFVGGVTFMIIYYRREVDALPTAPLSNRVWLLVASLVCVYGSYRDPSLPLSWLLIIPSVWGGLTLTLRGTAYLALTVSLIAAAMTYLPHNQFGYTGLLPAASIVDLLLIASTAFMLLLALMREQRARLIAELDRQGAESEAQRRMLATVFDSMNDGVMIVEDGRVGMYNSAARMLLGRAIPAGTPDSWVDHFSATAADGGTIDDDSIRAALFAEDGTLQDRVVELRVDHDGATRVLDLSAQPLGDGDRSLMVLLNDVTSQRARLQELTNFAGMVAHDLRGPLTVLDGWLEFVQDGRQAHDPERVDDALVKARESSSRMRQVIEDWLAYTVVQNGQLHPVRVRMDQLADEIVESHRVRWADAQPKFQLDLPHAVAADPGMVRQLLDNLVGNAIKYTAPDVAPYVEITSHLDTEPGWIRVDVTDRGIGIPEGQEEQIFEEFHRGPHEGRSAGTGLGLALTRRIVALHGGHLAARRNPEGGSTFSFTLPEA